nr:reverse transcriptase domain-containing protein [Tanacetum cinerariifolium]
MKAVTTRSGLAYERPLIPTNSPLEKVVEQVTEETTEKEHSNYHGRIDVCHALADLGASINLMPLSIWKKLSLPELTPTRMTLELADMSITRPKGVVEDVFFKVGKFHLPTDSVVVDFEADIRVPLILGRSLLRTGRALIDVYGEEITLRVNDESYNPKSSNPTLLVSDPSISKSDFCNEPIIKSSSPTLTPYETYFREDGWEKPCLVTAGDHRKLQLNELNELRDQACENSLIYKERTKKLHDSKIKNRIFNVGKLKTRWSGPFTITQVFPYGTVELSQPNGPNFKVNGHHVKHYFGGDIPSKVVPDLHTIYPTMIEDSRVRCVVPVHLSFTSFVCN